MENVRNELIGVMRAAGQGKRSSVTDGLLEVLFRHWGKFSLNVHEQAVRIWKQFPSSRCDIHKMHFAFVETNRLEAMIFQECEIWMGGGTFTPDPDSQVNYLRQLAARIQLTAFYDLMHDRDEPYGHTNAYLALPMFTNIVLQALIANYDPLVTQKFINGIIDGSFEAVDIKAWEIPSYSLLNGGDIREARGTFAQSNFAQYKLDKILDLRSVFEQSNLFN